MNNYITKKMFIIINVILFLIEVGLIYVTINSFLSKDFISPSELSTLEYIKTKIINIM